MKISQLNASDTFKLRPDAHAAAMHAAPQNGADDIFFKIDDEMYVASGVGLDTDNLQIGSQVEYRGQRATVAFIDQETNTLSEGLVNSAGSAAGIGLGAGLVTGVALGYFATGWNPSKAAAKAGLEIGLKIATATTLASLAVSGTKAAITSADYSVLHRYAANN